MCSPQTHNKGSTVWVYKYTGNIMNMISCVVHKPTIKGALYIWVYKYTGNIMNMISCVVHKPTIKGALYIWVYKYTGNIMNMISCVVHKPTIQEALCRYITSAVWLCIISLTSNNLQKIFVSLNEKAVKFKVWNKELGVYYHYHYIVVVMGVTRNL